MAVTHKPAAAPAPMLKNAAAAPVIYFDHVAAMGTIAGQVQVEVAVNLLMPKPDGSVAIDMSCTAHLRCSLQACAALRDACDRAIEMHTKSQQERTLDS